jgi:L-asparaginase
MTPLGFEKSDGLQSLTESLLAARLLPPGVYLVIHSQVFPIDRVRKDHKQASFVWTSAQANGARKKATVTPKP